MCTVVAIARASLLHPCSTACMQEKECEAYALPFSPASLSATNRLTPHPSSCPSLLEWRGDIGDFFNPSARGGTNIHLLFYPGVWTWFFYLPLDANDSPELSAQEGHQVIKLSQDGRLVQAIHQADAASHPYGVSVRSEVRTSVTRNHHVIVGNAEDKHLFTFGSKWSGHQGCFGKPCYIWFRCPWPHIYVTDGGRNEEGTFKTKTRPRIPQPTLLLLLLSYWSPHYSTATQYCMVCNLYGELVQEVDWRMDLEDVLFLAHDTCATSPCMD